MSRTKPWEVSEGLWEKVESLLPKGPENRAADHCRHDSSSTASFRGFGFCTGNKMKVLASLTFLLKTNRSASFQRLR